MRQTQCLFAFINRHTRVSYKSAPHSHACTEIIYNVGESGWLHEGDRKWRYLPNQIMVYQPGTEHWAQVDPDEELGYHVCIGVGGGEAELIKSRIFNAELDLIPLFKMVEDVLKAGHGSALTRTRLDLLAELICLSLRELDQQQRPESSGSHAETAKKLIDARFMEDLTMDVLASNVYISSDHLRYLFRREYGIGPIHYLLRKRIEYAQGLLKNTSRKIHEIAALCGFDDPYYFSRIFKKISGKSPQKYRQE